MDETLSIITPKQKGTGVFTGCSAELEYKFMAFGRKEDFESGMKDFGPLAAFS